MLTIRSRRSVALVALLGALLPIGVAGIARADSPGTIVVKPSAMNGWYFWNDKNDLFTGSPGAFVTGPATTPLGVGSVELGPLTDNGATAAGHSVIARDAYAGTALADITALSYTTYQPGPTLAIALLFDVRYRAVDTGYGGRLVFEPYQNGTVTVGSGWQSWSPLSGRWWATNTTTAGTGGTQSVPLPAGNCAMATPCSWSEINASFPGAKVSGRFLLKAGSNWNGFDGNADNLTIGVSGANTTFDFEAETACTTICYVSHATGNDAFGGDTPTTAKKTIQAAVDAVHSGGTVRVAAGTYPENVVVGRAMSIIGAGAADTKVLPASSNPNCGGSGGGSLCAGATIVFLVAADDVTIASLTVNGDNPALSGGIDVGGANVDARNGIITNHSAGTFNGLVVHDVTVKNVFLRGIYASSGGTFNLHDNTVTNVRGDAFSIGMFAFGGTGTMAHNDVSFANDALSANHSAGTQFLDNTVTHSGSGVHTDNAGDGGGSADLLKGNHVSDCLAGGYGVWTFVAYIGPSVESNAVTNCSVGLAVFGGADTGSATTHFTDNVVDGSHQAGSVGVYVTTDGLGFGAFDTSATLTGNRIRNNEAGIQVDETGAKIALVTAHHNAITSNSVIGLTSNTVNPVDATCNWWGFKTGPGPVGTGTGDHVSTHVTFQNWLVADLPSVACTGDATGPVITVPTVPVTEAVSATGAVVSYTEPTAADVSDGSLAPTCSAHSGDLFPIGTTNVTCTATDSASNTTTEHFNVTVVDTTKPVIVSHATVHADATSSAGAVVNYTAPATTDAVDGPGTATCVPASGSTFAIGTTDVACDAVDAHSNHAIQLHFDVVVADTDAPVIAPHGDVHAEATSLSGAVVTYTAPATTDAVDPPGVAACAPASGSMFPIGTTDIACDASDSAHHNAVTTHFNVIVTAPRAELTPAIGHAYTDRVLGTTSNPVTFTLKNIGTSDLLVTTVNLGAVNPLQFAISNDHCSSVTLSPNATCTVDVSFQPTVLGLKTSSLDIASNAINGAVSVPLSGTGIQPDANVAPLTLAFGSQLLGTNSVAQSVTVTNTGNGPLTVSGVPIDGTNPGQFHLDSQTCTGTPVAGSGGTCTITVSYRPNATGAKDATLTVVSDDPDSPSIVVSLTGTGIQPAASLAPTTFDFGSALVGTATGTHPFVLTNTGSAPLHVTDVTLGGSNPGQFAIDSQDCTAAAIAVSGTCTIQAHFVPTTTGSDAKSATLSVASDAPGTTSAALSGTRLQPHLALTPDSHGFGDQAVNVPSAPFAFAVTNDGTADLHVGAVTVGGTNSGHFLIDTNGCDSAVLAPAQSCSIGVTFVPHSSGVKNARLDVASDSAGSPAQSALSGTGRDQPLANNIRITVDARPNSAQNFSFTGDLGHFFLDDDSSATLPSVRNSGALAAGTYAVTLAAVPGWSLTGLTCSTGETTDLATRTTTIDLGAAEGVQCTFVVTRRQPDASISLRRTSAYKGNDIYSAVPKSNQTLTQSHRPIGSTTTFYVRIQNDSAARDSFKVQATATGAATMTVQYFVAGVNRTAAITAGTYITPSRATLAFTLVKVVVKVNAGTPALARRTVVLTASSVSEPSRVDVVRAITRH